MIEPPEGQVIPDGHRFEGMGRCRGCGSAMAWVRTPKGARAPLDEDGTNHFITCPQRDDFRRKGGRRA